MRFVSTLLVATAAVWSGGCGHLDLSAEGDPSRVLIGEVAMGEAGPLPADTVVTVRVVDASVAGMPPEVLGSQTITHPGVSPISYRVEYRADDARLMRGLNIEARVSYGGKVRFYNLNRYAVSLGSAGDSHRINVISTGP